MAQEQRLAQEIQTVQQQWDLLTEKLQHLERAKILAMTPNESFSLEHQIADLKKEREQVEQQLTALEKQQADLDRKIDLLRQENLQQDKLRQTTQRKSVGTKPYVEKLFVDRVAYLAKLTESVCCDETHLIVIVGQGGIGKTALAAKFCDEIEKAGYQLTREERQSGDLAAKAPLSHSLIRAIVYVSKTEMAAFTLEQVFAKLAQTLAPEDAARLEPILKDPKAEAALKTEKLLDGLRGEPTLLVLDNFEVVLAETQPAVRPELVEGHGSTPLTMTVILSEVEGRGSTSSPRTATGSNIVQTDLDVFLHTVCATQHSLKVIITSRYEVNLKTFGVCQKIVLNEGLKIDDAVDFLRRLGQEVPQIQQASDAELRQLAQKVHGVPMALRSLAGFLVERAQRRLTVAQLLADQTRFAAFKKHDFKEGLRKLIAEQYRILPEAAQLALQAMSVYNAPVKPVAVQYLFPALDAETALDDLAYSYFLAQHNRATDQFELHPSVQEYAYEQAALTMPGHQCPGSKIKDAEASYEQASACLSFEPGALAQGGVWGLHARAADFYAELKKPESDWKSLPDVQPHLEEIEQRLKAGDYDRAARVLNEIDFDYLQLWGYSRLVVALREQLVGKLTDEYLIRTNYGYLGMTYRNIGRVKESIPFHEKALESARKEKNKQAEGAWLGNLGNVYADLGEPTRAIEYYTQALTLAREIGDKRGEGNRLGNLGNAYADLGEPTRAMEYYTQALTIAQEIGNKRIEGILAGNLGEAYLEMCVQQGAETWRQQAVEAHQRALEIHQEVGNSQGVPEQYKRLGVAHLFASDMEQAAAHFQCCVEACEQALAQSPLYLVFYYRAFALLALTCLIPQNPPLPLPGGESLAVQAYRKAIEVNAAAGVLRAHMHDVERLQQILAQRGLDTPDARAATAAVLALLQAALTSSPEA